MHVITGGAGFLGSALLWELNRRGETDVIIVDNLARSDKWRNLAHLEYADYIHRDKFREMMRSGSVPFNVESIVHLGACSSTTEMDADFLMDNNLHYSQEVCRFALDRGARFVNASSAATYGDGSRGFGAADVPLNAYLPLNMYGYSKHLFDLWLQRAGLMEQVASLKFFNVYGPNEYHKGEMSSVAFKLFHEIGSSGSATLFASNCSGIRDGEQKRDFVYVKDCAALMAWLLADGRGQNGVMNVGTGRAASFNDLAGAVFAAMGRPERINYKPMPKVLEGKYQNFTQADMGWLAGSGYPGSFRGVREGVGDYVAEHLSRPDPYLGARGAA